MAVLETTKGGYQLWNYLPSVPAAVIFAILFLLMTTLIAWRMFATKTWFCVPLVIGGIFEFAGYCARASAYNKTGRIMPYAVQNIFILLGPALFAASIYMCLARIIRGVCADHLSLIRPQRLTKVFVGGDVLSFVVQGGAAGFMVTGKNPKIGEGIVVAGLMVQIIMFGFFMATAAIFKRRVQRVPTIESQSQDVPWRRSLQMLFIASTCIIVRSVFRVIEYAMGNSGYLLRHEWTLYIFDTLLMFAVMVVYWLWYPTWISRGKMEDVTEI